MEAATDPLAAKISPEDLPTWTVFMPVALNLPNVIFALILLRNVGKADRPTEPIRAGNPSTRFVV